MQVNLLSRISTAFYSRYKRNDICEEHLRQGND